MKNPILHIPSVISQSCFTDVNGGVVDIKENEINKSNFVIDCDWLQVSIWNIDIISISKTLMGEN